MNTLPQVYHNFARTAFYGSGALEFWFFHIENQCANISFSISNIDETAGVEGARITMGIKEVIEMIAISENPMMHEHSPKKIMNTISPNVRIDRGVLFQAKSGGSLEENGKSKSLTDVLGTFGNFIVEVILLKNGIEHVWVFFNQVPKKVACLETDKKTMLGSQSCFAVSSPRTIDRIHRNPAWCLRAIAP
ncbi:hypothetical protein Tco_1379089 [Tanacetum coccineum]